MIELTMEEFLLWLVGVPLLGIGFFILLAKIKKRSNIRARQKQILHCNGCGCIYQNRDRERSPKCPEYGRANERGSSRRLG